MPFNGITNLRDAKESVKLKPWQLAEIKKCALDPLYFMNTYMYINTKDNGMQLFKTWPFQDEAVKRFLKYRFNINKWSRQVGKSTIVRGFILWYAMFHGDQLVAMLANKLALAKEQLQLLRDSYIALPFWLQPGVKLWNKMSIQFSNNTRILVAATSIDGIRGFSPNLLYLDEFAFLRSGLADDFMASVFPSISSGKKTRVIITSCVTPDTLVYTNTGIRPIGDFLQHRDIHGGYEIPDYQVCGFNQELNHGTLFHNEGEVDTIRINTRFASVEGSETHKYYGCKNGEYRIYRAHELEVGDWVAVKYGMNCWGSDKIDYIDTNNNPRANRIGNMPYITEDLAYLIGLYIAEGHIFTQEYSTKGSGTHHNLIITCGDDISKAIDSVGMRWRMHRPLHYEIASKSLIQLLQYLGFDTKRKAPAKEIPARLMRMSKKCTIAMLQGMYDGDGCAENAKHYRILYTTTSKKMAQQLRAILLNFGILSSLESHDNKPSKLVKRHNYRAYVVSINRIDMVNKFFTDIGFRFARKQTRYEPETGNKFSGFKNDVIPFSHDLFMQLKKNGHIKYNEYTGLPLDKSRKHISRKMLLNTKQLLSQKYDLSGTFFDYVQPDIIWTQITSIDHGHGFVCDFSLDNIDNDEHCHSVVYNGILGHQTPNGLNQFYRMWENAVDEDTASYHDLMSKYVRSVVKWNEVPGRDEQWGIDEMARMGEQKFRQEYECEFIGSAVTLIDYKILQKLKASPPIPMAGVPKDYQIRMFQKPMPRQKLEVNQWTYIASIDTGYGIRKDYHVLHILLARSNIDLEEVFVMSSNTVTIQDFCARAYIVLDGYGTPPLTIEFNGPGMTTYGIMFNDLQYENLVNYDNKMRGMWATDTIKQATVLLLKLYIERFYLKIHDETTINELMSFSPTTESGRKWGAVGGNHDDNVTSLYWCVYYAAMPWFEGKQEELPFLSGIEMAFTAIGNSGQDANRALEFVKDKISQREQAALGRLQQEQADGQPIN